MEPDKSTARANPAQIIPSVTGHNTMGSVEQHLTIRDEPGPGSTQGLQSEAKGEEVADRVGDKLQHVTEGLQLATE